MEENVKSDMEIAIQKMNDDENLEVKVITNYMASRLRKRLACNIIFTGELGKGKSYSGLRLLELWYKRYFEEEFPTTHICNDLISAMQTIKKFKRKGEGILLEELSVLIGSRDSLSKQNKLFNKFMDIVRIKQAIIIGNLPFLSFVDKHMIILSQIWIETLGINFRQKVCVCKPLILQPASFKADPYKHKFLDDDNEPINFILFKKPSEELCKFYDNFKLKAVDEVIDEMVAGMEADKKKKDKAMNKGVEGLKERIVELVDKIGVKETSNMTKKSERTIQRWYKEAKEENDTETT